MLTELYSVDIMSHLIDYGAIFTPYDGNCNAMSSIR